MTSPRRRRAAALSHSLWLFCFCEAVWTLLTWTTNVESDVTGGCVSVAVTAALLPIFRDTATIRLTPARLVAAGSLAARSLVGVVTANVKLARRIWSPSMPLRSGMVEVATKARSDAGLAAVGLVTSLIVDNQIVDISRPRNRLLYHAVHVPTGGSAYDEINGPVDRRVAALEATVDG
ncbi:MAG TPA: Na+/H+ antiporter subunit E [Mycobacteriales bacterium]|nr:Na+/H+ antiporter subunit E [Mycobacteriales bacterium]